LRARYFISPFIVNGLDNNQCFSSLIVSGYALECGDDRGGVKHYIPLAAT
jgi:hypothetical protein